MSRSPAVEARLNRLHDQWVEFTEQPHARVLRWVVEPEEVRVVEAWVKKEQHEEAGECPDLLLRMDTPFEQPEAYGHELRQVLEAWVAESAEPVELGPARSGQPGVEAFLSACERLQRQYAEVCEVLAVVLVPQRVSSAQAWQQWLRQALEHLRSPKVRLVVLDDVRTRELEPLTREESQRVWTAVAGLDLLGAMQQVAREAGQRDTPGGRYRELQVALMVAAKRGELAEVERLGREAVALASGQGWHGLAAAAQWVVAGALLQAGRPLEAAERYRQAEDSAAKAERQGEPQGAQVRLRTRLALGAALVVAQQWRAAAALFEETAPLARKLTERHLELECWRQGSFCREAVREGDQAWEDGLRAWEVGRALPAQARSTSTLPYVAEALVRLSGAREGKEAARRMEAQAEALLGPDWRPHPQR